MTPQYAPMVARLMNLPPYRMAVLQEAQQAAEQQRQFEGDLRHAAMQGDGMTRQQAGALADQHQKQADQVKKLEQDMQNAVRGLMSSQRQASNKLRQALGDLQRLFEAESNHLP